MCMHIMDSTGDSPMDACRSSIIPPHHATQGKKVEFPEMHHKETWQEIWHFRYRPRVVQDRADFHEILPYISYYTTLYLKCLVSL